MLLDLHPNDHYSAAEDPLGQIDADTMLYFLLNVGNADSQLIVLPADGGVRHMVIVDVGRVADEKMPRLIDELLAAGVLTAASRIRLLVATHPHSDHVGGMPNLLRRHGGLVDEVWDAAYYWRTGSWHELMHWLEDHPHVARLHPTSGTRRHIGSVALSALSPSIRLRNSYDTYGVYVNNASIALLVEFPVIRVFTGDDATFPQVGRTDRRLRRERLLLGADAQTTSWSHVDVDYPTLAADHAPHHRLLGQADGNEPLGGELFKVPHHCSKKGLNLELVERVHPYLSLVSAAATTTGHAFPHGVAIDQLREAIEARATTGLAHSTDCELGIHTTADVRGGGGGRNEALGSILVAIDPNPQALSDRYRVWRLRDASNARVAHLRAAYRYIGPISSR